MTRAAEYRRLARGCLEAARGVQDEDGRTALVQMAQVWLRLADEQTEEMGEPAPPTPPEKGRPVVQQQQQQVQPNKDHKKE
jgi:hypothetical protein